MSTYAKEHKQYHIALIRELIVRKRDMSSREIEIKLAEKGVQLSEPYIYSLRKKILVERSMRADRKVLSTALSAMEDAFSTIMEGAWEIVDKHPIAETRLKAMKEIRECYSTMFDKLFDAGVFEKNRGKLKVDLVNPETAREIKEMLNKWGIETDDKPIEIPEKL